MPQGRFWRTVRAYLDPFVFFKSITIGPPAARTEAQQYNRSHRGILLAYAVRWAAIALACAGGMAPLAALARAEPILCIPILGLEIGFSAAVCMLLVSVAVYVVLGLDD
jgi:hypothetical protein